MDRRRAAAVLCAAALTLSVVLPPAQNTAAEQKETAECLTEYETETEAQTEPVTEMQTEPVTEAPTEPETEVTTEPVTETPTEPVTELVTEAPTEPETEVTTEPEAEAPTETETESETEKLTELVTEAPTEPETEVTTEPETEVPTESGTEAPTESGTEAPTETETEAQTEPSTEIPAEPETPEEPKTESPTEPAGDSVIEIGPELLEKLVPETKQEPEKEPQTEPASENETETEPQTEPETEPETEAELETEPETESDDAQAMKPVTQLWQPGGGNVNYYWDPSWYVSQEGDFRFTQVEKDCAITQKQIYAFEKPDDTSKKVGVLPYFSAVYILEEEDGDAWAYIESGDVRGFVKTKWLSKDSFTQETLAAVGDSALAEGILLCEKADNAAYTYTHTTVQDVLAEKKYGVTLHSGGILEYPSKTAREIGTVSSGNLVYLLEEAVDGWMYVESGDVRGFLLEENLLSGEVVDAVVAETGEEKIKLAKEVVAPEENRSVYYTLLSTKAASKAVGEQVAEYALRFVGKLPYIYGGASLSYGVDCSGFTQAVFAAFGVRLPRLAQEQGVSGEMVGSLSEARPGDIIYYASGPHVGIYIGNGQIVHSEGNSGNTASNPGRGVQVSSADYMGITSIRRYLIDTAGQAASGGSRTDATPYTQEQLELIWAIVAQEDNGSYEGALAVISSAMNRTESAVWGYLGGNALSQLTAPGQYCYSMDNYWRARLNGNVPDYVKQAVYDCLDRGIRNHGYTSFRSTKGSQTGPNAVQIGGNWFFGN